MALKTHLVAFFAKAIDDPKIGTAHISLYLAIVSLWQQQGGKSPLLLFSKAVMKTAKIASSATYVRLMKALCEGGYLAYEPSYYKGIPSKIHVLSFAAENTAQS